MKRLRCLLSLLVLSLSVTALHAAYLHKVPVTVRQPDGRIIHCFATGDEFHNWLHDENNYTIMQDHSTGCYVYATLKAGQLRPTALQPGRDDPASAGLTPGTNVSAEERAQKRTAFLAAAPMGVSAAPTTGTINNIVIFVRFLNEPEFADSVSYYDGLFNDSASAANSMYNYFREASYNQLTVSSTYYPVASGPTIVSYQDGHTRDYYRPYDATTNPAGYQWYQRVSREQDLVYNAVLAVQGQIPGTLNFDANNDGYIDNVCFIVSGSPDGWSSLLWPHKNTWGAGVHPTIQGKYVEVWNLQLRRLSLGMTPGVLCHEMLHTLGAPDLYRYSGDHVPVGHWDVMAVNHNPPQHPTTYLKWKYLKWIPSIPLIAATGTYSLSPSTSASNNCFRIPSPNSAQEYFVAEYRRKTGTFESTLPDEGLIVYRIYPWASGNDAGPPDEVYVYRPFGTSTDDGLPNQAPFSYESGRTIFSDSTNPTPFLSNNDEGGLYLSNVGTAGNTITFEYQKSGMLSITPDSLVLGQQGTVTVVVLAPKTADYQIRVRDKNGTGPPPWQWDATVTPVALVAAGTHRVFSFLVQPSYATETFEFTLLKLNPGASLWEAFASQLVTLGPNTAEKGNLVVTVTDAEGWPGPYDKATVKILDNSGQPIAAAKTNSTSVATFTGLHAGAGYSCAVYCYLGKPFGDQYWGTKPNVTVVGGTTINVTFLRNAPYAPEIKAYDVGTGAEVTGDTVSPGTAIRVQLTVKNPNVVGAAPTIVGAHMIVDRDAAPAYDFDYTSDFMSIAVGQTRMGLFVTLTPTIEGRYCYAEEVLSRPGGIETTLSTDASLWGNLFYVQGDGPGTGDVSIAVSDAENWGDAGASASVQCYDSTSRQLGEQLTDGAGNAIFSGVPVGSGYSYTVRYLSSSEPSPFGTQYWGRKGGITIARGQILHENFIRNVPYALAINVYDSLTSVNFAYDTVFVGTHLRVDLRMRNPAYPGAEPAMCRGRVVLDRDQQPPYDVDKITLWTSFDLDQTREMGIYVTPTLPGSYYAAAAVYTDVSGVETTTDGGKWDSRALFLVEERESTQAYDVAASWNMISVPLTMKDCRTTTMYPSTTSQAFAYRNGYITKDTLQNGVGYWLKFPASETISLTGLALSTDTIPVFAGWNMIGSISVAVPVDSIASNPPGLTVSPFYGYSSGYATTTTIEPHKGYWVKTDQDGELILDARRGGGGSLNIVLHGELPPDPPFLTTVTERGVPTVFGLEQNYPNPFNPLTVIEYTVGGVRNSGLGASNVKLVVYDLLGREVAVLVNETLQPGRYTRKFDASGLVSGIYLYRITAGTFVETKKFLLVR